MNDSTLVLDGKMAEQFMDANVDDVVELKVKARIKRLERHEEPQMLAQPADGKKSKTPPKPEVEPCVGFEILSVNGKASDKEELAEQDDDEFEGEIAKAKGY